MELHARSRTYYHRLGLVTVYRTLEVLDNLGLVRRVHREDGCHAYAPATAGHRHLVICQRCGRAEEFAGDDLSALLLKVEQATGYVVSDHWLQLFGTCPRCRVADPDLPRDHTRVRAGKDQHPRRGPGQP
jgi:Fe2+ or Zn2+ uptake regulation protein